MTQEKIEKEIQEAKTAVKEAKKEIHEAEQATAKAQEEVVEAAGVIKGEKKKEFIYAAKDLEKANSSAAESCEATEEAEVRINE